MGTQLRLVLTRVVLPVLVICTVVVLAVVREPRSVAEQPASEAPPLEVPEWGKVTVKTVCLEIRQSYPQIEERFSLPLLKPAEKILEDIGIQVASESVPCDAELTFDVTARAVGETYMAGIFRYTGAEIEGRVRISAAGRTPVIRTFRHSLAPPVQISCPGRDCDARDKRQAPFRRAFYRPLVDLLIELWGAEAFVAQVRSGALEDLPMRSLGFVPGLFSLPWPQGIPPRDDAIPVLSWTLVNSPDATVRTAAAIGLGGLGPEASQAIPDLVNALRNDADSGVRITAARQLRHLGLEASEVASHLNEVLRNDADGSVRSAAAEQLAHTGLEAREVVPYLIEALRNDPDGRVRSTAAEELAHIGPEAREAVPDLIDALRNWEAGTRRVLLQALKAITGADFGYDADRWWQWWQSQSGDTHATEP
jgi:hypothetical protein